MLTIVGQMEEIAKELARYGEIVNDVIVEERNFRFTLFQYQGDTFEVAKHNGDVVSIIKI
jgi:hypothetical protein